jgi:hypothetical protein
MTEKSVSVMCLRAEKFVGIAQDQNPSENFTVSAHITVAISTDGRNLPVADE